MSAHPYVAALDGLRGVSILAVVLFHVAALSGLARHLRGGLLGVSVFFTISGYLITSLLLREVTRTRAIDLVAFWGRRIRRLAAPLLVIVVVAVLLADMRWLGFDWGAWPGFRAGDALAGLWGYMNWHLVDLGSAEVVRGLGPLSPVWSLAVEEQYYLVMALLFAAVSRLARPVRALAIVVGVMWLASLLIAALTAASPQRLEFGTDVRMGELAAGALLAIGLLKWPELVQRRPGLVDRLGWVALALLVCSFAVVDFTPPWLLHGGFHLVGIVSVVAVLAALSTGSFSRAMAARPLVWFGSFSYSLYLAHWPIGLLLNDDRLGFAGWPAAAVKFVASVGGGLLLHQVVEQPARRAAGLRGRPLIVTWVAASAAVSAVAMVML